MTNALMQLQFFPLNNLVNAVNKVFKVRYSKDLSVVQRVTNDSRVIELWMKN